MVENFELEKLDCELAELLFGREYSSIPDAYVTLKEFPALKNDKFHSSQKPKNPPRVP